MTIALPGRGAFGFMRGMLLSTPTTLADAAPAGLTTNEAGWLLVGLGVGIAVTALVARTIHHRYRLKWRQAEARARAAERMAQLGKLTGGLAHEIKNPLSTIGLNAQLVGESIAELPISSEERGRLTRRVDSLRREVDRLRGILTDFLEYAGELRLARREVDINQVIRELADFFMPQAERAGVRVRTALSGVGANAELVASVDAGLFKQAILNLMLNAVQAMEGAGAAARELIIRTERTKDGGAVVHVIDTGPGIDAPTLGRIFDPYFTTKAGGSGLGLPTCRRIVEAHGGELEVVSEVGRGTDVVVRLPPSEAPAAGPGGGVRVEKKGG